MWLSKKSTVSLKAKADTNINQNTWCKFSAKKTWARIFAFSLAKSQKIRFQRNAFIGAVYDSNGYYYSDVITDYDKKGNKIGFVTENKIPEGTYYIEISEDWGNTSRKYTTGSYYTIKWK